MTFRQDDDCDKGGKRTETDLFLCLAWAIWMECNRTDLHFLEPIIRWHTNGHREDFHANDWQ